MTTGQIASILDVAPRTVAKWIDGGLLPAMRYPRQGLGATMRRVHRSDFEVFQAAYRFNRQSGSRVILSVGHQPSTTCGLDVTIVSSAFDAGLFVAQRHPQIILFDWSLGSIEAAQVAAGVARFPNYAPLLVAVGHCTDQEALSRGYHHSLLPPVGCEDLMGLLGELSHA